MDFESLQRIWDAPANQKLYALDETALRQIILTKKKKSLHITHVSELMIIILNAGAGFFIFFTGVVKGHQQMLMLVLAAWMWLVALYMLVSRIRRIRLERRFDDTMLGQLQHALSTATYQVRISKLMLWNGLLLLLYCAFMVFQSGKSFWYAIAIGVVFVVAWRASLWEYNLYKNRQRELDKLLKKLQQEMSNA